MQVMSLKAFWLGPSLREAVEQERFAAKNSTGLCVPQSLVGLSKISDIQLNVSRMHGFRKKFLSMLVGPENVPGVRPPSSQQ